MIINTGQRTDIPGFYSQWLANRLREGSVMVRNPYNPTAVTRYRLSPDVVDLIGFCTKNPAPMLDHMALLAPYRQYWYVTITPYGHEIEPNTPDKGEVLRAFRALSKIVGADNIGWRYDPVFIDERYTVQRHIRDFAFIAQSLKGFTHNVVISFIDLYEKTKRNFPEARAVSREDRHALGRALVSLARACGMTLRPCGEGDELADYGADCSGCMTTAMVERAVGSRMRFPAFIPARESCACYLACDIGAYNTCGHLCRYCYANHDERAVRENMKNHDPASPLLIGRPRPEDVVRDAKQASWIDPQLRMEF